MKKGLHYLGLFGLGVTYGLILLEYDILYPVISFFISIFALVKGED